MLTRAYLKERRGTRECVSACVRVPEFIEVSVGACVCVCAPRHTMVSVIACACFHEGMCACEFVSSSLIS